MRGKPYFVVAALVAAAVGLGGGWWAAQPHSHLSQYERLGAEIGCQCGTCPNRPIATCGCPFAAGMLTELTALTDGSLSDDEVLATFVGRYDGSIRIKPASSGLDLLAWVAPMLLLTVGAVGVGAVLMRWASLSEAAAANAVSGDDSTAGVGAKRGVDDSAARAIVERELENLGG